MSSLEGLYSTQEEADTRLVLHAIMLSRDHPRIIIRCDDTDTLVLLVYYWSRGALAGEIYMHAGHSGNSSQRNDSYLFTISVPNSAKQHSIPYQPCMLRQDVPRQVLYTDLESERHVQLSPKIQMPSRAWKHSRMCLLS